MDILYCNMLVRQALLQDAWARDLKVLELFWISHFYY